MFICEKCGSTVERRKTYKAIGVIFIVWFLFFLAFIPLLSFIFLSISIWAFYTNKPCEQCGSKSLLPIETPRGAELFKAIPKPDAPKVQRKPGVIKSIATPDDIEKEQMRRFNQGNV